MQLSARIATLRLAETFTISRESQDEADVVQVEVRHDGTVGFGEAAPIERYDESAGSALAYVEAHADALGDDPFALEEIFERLPREQFAARDAIDAALHDLQGKLARPAGAAAARPAARGPADVVDDLARRSRRHGPARREATGEGRFSRLKLKLGGRDGLDVERVRAVRGVTDLPLQVDVNEYWSLDEALEALPQMGLAVLRAAAARRRPGRAGAEAKRSPIPIFVDEDCHTLADVAACAERAHGINIKLASRAGSARRSGWRTPRARSGSA